MSGRKKMTLAKELAVLRRLHAAEIAVNPPKRGTGAIEKHEEKKHVEHKKEESKAAPAKEKEEKKEKKEKAPTDSKKGGEKAEKTESKKGAESKKGDDKAESKKGDDKAKSKKGDDKAESKKGEDKAESKKGNEKAQSKKGNEKEEKANKTEGGKSEKAPKKDKEKTKAAADNAAARKTKEGLEDLLIRKFFYVPAFEIYGGVAGLYDFGPTGCAVKANLLEFWRQHFVLTENMLEVSCASLTPEVVLKASGHVDKFTDFMVRDVKTADCYRADKLLEEHIDKMLEDAANEPRKAELLAHRTQAGAYPRDTLEEVLNELKVKAPDTGNDLSPPFAFNLMFATQIGPTGKLLGFLRPETAQGIFVNFKRLLEYNGGRMPFAAAQIGLAFRNEIAPRAGLLRVREFPLAEIEHFVDPANKNHPRFKEVANIKMRLLSRQDQTGEDQAREMTVGDAVAQGIINNETLGYFMARTQLFMHDAGITPEKLRFRQHKSTEMAHYAKDCWDAECFLHTYGWVECVGHADRAAFDLEVHTRDSKVVLCAEEQLPHPVIERLLVVKLNSKMVGQKYRDRSKILAAYVETMPKDKIAALKSDLEKGSVDIKMCDGEVFTLTPDMVSVVEEERKISVRKYTPSVIEPSYGVGRIIYSILDHSYTVRKKKGEEQKYLRLSPVIAPVKASILPLSNDPEVVAVADEIARACVPENLTTKTDTSGASIGKKYARSDEIGVPFALTVDFDSPKDRKVTLRNRDTTTQVRIPVSDVADTLFRLVNLVTTWDEVEAQFDKFQSPDDLE